jgi:DNA primase
MKRQIKFNRSLLPTPAKYYSQQFPGLKIKSEWVKVHCCFHEDNKPSLSISMIDGHFKCHACDAKGCDIISFHQQRYKLGFCHTLKDLGVHYG